ncbi:hypothetical protein [Sandarakinorhabdus sp.]|uniref:hypothetical protein n=1 Tax=Sandarakinorhabdus sp. TaxID=1916663 RepID=UPI0028AE84D6|nr:hypothetical protein [Sandarakinorhabdus sp.]
MAGISTQQFTPWANYHLTRGTRYGDLMEPLVPVELLGKFHCSDLAGIADPGRFAQMTDLVFDYLDEFAKLYAHRKLRHQVSKEPGKGDFRVFPTVQVGSGWSFSGLIGADDNKLREAKLDCSGLAGCLMLADGYRAPEAQGPITLAGGGTRLQELADWAAGHGLSIQTSGTHMGMTLAGGMATASHGSRLGYGGIQNMIAGMLIVTGEEDAVWLEPESAPVLNEAALAALLPARMRKAGLTALPRIQDDAMFADALVHLGCMGIVAAVAVRLVPDQLFERHQFTHRIDASWLAMLARRDWDGVAAMLGQAGREPQFYELTVDPHAWDEKAAAHILYFLAPEGATPSAPQALPPGTGDTFALLGARLSGKSFQLPDALLPVDVPDLPDDGRDDDTLAPPPGPEVPMILFDPDGDQDNDRKTAYDQYLHIAGFDEPKEPITASWRFLHRGTITGGYPGALYNASWAIPLDRIADVLPAICAAVHEFPRSFVFTLRFVSHPAGTMAFTRWTHSCVIEIDGLSPWIARKVANRMEEDGHNDDFTRQIFRYVTNSMPRATRAVCAALDRIDGLEWSMHFAKRGFIDRHKVQKDFAAKLARWHQTRDTLLTQFGRDHFWNWGAVNMGLMPWPRTPDVPD